MAHYMLTMDPGWNPPTWAYLSRCYGLFIDAFHTSSLKPTSGYLIHPQGGFIGFLLVLSSYAHTSFGTGLQLVKKDSLLSQLNEEFRRKEGK
jgi:hypothetical protein